MELLEHQAFAGVEAHIAGPTRPTDVVAPGEGEAGPLRLGDLDGLLVVRSSPVSSGSV